MDYTVSFTTFLLGCHNAELMLHIAASVITAANLDSQFTVSSISSIVH